MRTASFLPSTVAVSPRGGGLPPPLSGTHGSLSASGSCFSRGEGTPTLSFAHGLNSTSGVGGVGSATVTQVAVRGEVSPSCGIPRSVREAGPADSTGRALCLAHGLQPLSDVQDSADGRSVPLATTVGSRHSSRVQVLGNGPKAESVLPRGPNLGAYLGGESLRTA